jgi:hypothetical protein
MASSISTVAVDFVANVAKYMSGLDTMATKTKSWSDKTKKDTQGATDAFDGTSKAINNLAKQLIALVAIEKVGAAFANAAKQVSQLADEAEKVGASAEQFDKLRLAAERNGANIGDVKIAYKELQKSINEALGGTKETVKAFNDLGLSYSYLAGLNPDDRFREIAQSLSEVDDANKRAELGVRLLGKSYTELSPLIAKGAAGIDTGGRGSLTGNEIKNIDKVTKSFEELGRILDTTIKKSLSDLSPIILKISEALAYIARNLTSFAALVGLAFAPAAILKFAEAFAFLANVINSQVVKAILAANAGMSAMISLNFASFLSNLTLPLLTLANGFKSFAAAALAAFKTLTIFLIVFEAVTRVVGKGAEILGFDQYAEALKQIRESVEDTVLGFAGFETAEDKVNAFVKATGEKLAAARNRLNTSGNESGKVIDLVAEAAAKAKKETDDYVASLENLGKNLESEFGDPLDIAEQKLIKYTNAVDLGIISIDTYRKAVTGLISQLSEIDRYKIELKFGTVIPFEAIPSSYKVPTISQEQEFAQRSQRSEIFGAGTLRGLPKGMTLPTLQVSTFTEDEKKRIQDLGKTLTEEGRSATEVYNQRVKDIEAASMAVDDYGKNVLSVEGKTKALTDATTQFAQSQAQAFADATPYWENIIEFTKNFADGLASAIVAGQNFGDALKNVFQDVLKQIAVLIIRTTILQAIMASIGLASAPAALAFGQMTGIVGKASGGPVTGGMPYKVGEAGPEMFVPSQNGVIMPNGMTGGSQTPIVQNIYIQTGVSQTVRAEMAALLPTFKQQAIAGVAEAKQRGGSYARALSAA